MLIHQKEVSDLMTCSYYNWHENFKKHCIKSHCLQIPENVLNYLKQDLFVLPTECKILHSGQSSQSSDRKTVGEATNFDESDDEEETPPTFPEFSQKITKTIEKLGKNKKFNLIN